MIEAEKIINDLEKVDSLEEGAEKLKNDYELDDTIKVWEKIEERDVDINKNYKIGDLVNSLKKENLDLIPDKIRRAIE